MSGVNEKKSYLVQHEFYEGKFWLNENVCNSN